MRLVKLKKENIMRLITQPPDWEWNVFTSEPAPNKNNINEIPPPLININVPLLNLLTQCLYQARNKQIYFQWGLQWGNNDDNDLFGKLLRYPDKRPDYITEVVPLPEDKSVLWIWIVDRKYYSYIPPFDLNKFVDLRGSGIEQIGLRSLDDVNQFIKKHCKFNTKSCCK